MVKKRKFNQNKIISASEVGQFNYCSVSWYLQRCGYEPKSANLDLGTKKHKELGNLIDNIDSNLKKSKIMLVLGLVFLIIGLFYYFFEVIL